MIDRSFSLKNFEGSLELLLYLIQKDEVDVCDVPIQELTKQLIDTLKNDAVEINAELMGIAATLLLIKSQKLLPKGDTETNELEEDPRIELIEKLIEYCHFRDAATTLVAREQTQKAYFPRAAPLFHKEPKAGLEEIGLDDLKQVMLDVIKRTEKNTGIIKDEEWQIAPKITWLRHEIGVRKQIFFNEVFTDEKSRGELIVSFLALLEMIKLQELRIVRENNLLYIIKYEHKPS